MRVDDPSLRPSAPRAGRESRTGQVAFRSRLRWQGLGPLRALALATSPSGVVGLERGFYSGILYEVLGFPVGLFPVRPMSGWLAQRQKRLEDPGQKIARLKHLHPRVRRAASSGWLNRRRVSFMIWSGSPSHYVESSEEMSSKHSIRSLAEVEHGTPIESYVRRCSLFVEIAVGDVIPFSGEGF